MGGVASGGGDVRPGDLDGLGAGRAELALAMELGEGAGLAALIVGFGAMDWGNFLFDAFLVEAEAIVVVKGAIFEIVLRLVVGHGPVIDGGGDGQGTAEAPFGDGDALDEVKFKDGAGAERVNIILLELIKKSGVLRAQDDCSGGEAVSDGILRRTLLAFRGDRAVRLRTIAARSFDLRLGSHERN